MSEPRKILTHLARHGSKIDTWRGSAWSARRLNALREAWPVSSLALSTTFKRGVERGKRTALAHTHNWYQCVGKKKRSGLAVPAPLESYLVLNESIRAVSA